RTLQALEHNHAHSPRAPVRKFRAGERRILAGHAESSRLMAGLAICRKNFFAAVARGKFSLLAASRSARNCFLRCWRRTHRVESAAGEISRETAEVRAAEENRQSVDGDQPY